jgi:hypothetical protein
VQCPTQCCTGILTEIAQSAAIHPNICGLRVGKKKKVWGYTSISSWRLRQEDKLEASLGNLVRLHLKNKRAGDISQW